MSILDRLLETSAALRSVRVSHDGEIVAVNPALARQVGTPAAELRGAPVTTLVAAHEADRITAWVRDDEPLPEGRVAVSFVTATGDPFTLRCIFERGPDTLHLLGEPEMTDDSAAASDLLRLNNEMATLARESARRRRELEQTQARLEAAHEELKTSYWHLQKIQEVLPICMKCGRVKGDGARWESVADYLRANDIFLSHGYCPSCEELTIREFGLENEP